MKAQELLKYFNEDLFILDVKAKNKDELLAELVDRFVEKSYIKKSDIVLEMLTQREKLGSTGIGKGIAIPHGRTTSASEVMIAFARSKDGIDYEAIDSKPVHLVFMIIAPPQDENNMYLPILGKIVEILNKSKNRKTLLSIESFVEFIDFLAEA
ncbi:PTS sugar transporter subunit IIA [candidate division KSB1 bacterium]|nr:PTS sugar transporter subunit IIA [candidate division KSB1 bacterium]